MHKRRQLTKVRSSKQLLKTLTDNPGLPAFVRNLQAPVLKRLIEHVGLHDAGELIALTTTRQLREIFEESLWQTLIPGQAESLRPEKFLEWLDVLLEVSPAFAVERLMELGETFVVLNVAPLVTVIDRTVAMEHQEGDCACVMCRLDARDAPFEVIGEYIVTGLHEDEWDTVKSVLVELETEDAGFVGRVLARCSGAPTLRDFNPDGGMLLADETYEREQRRERSGFVTPPMAAQFLKSAKLAARTALVTQTGYDAISQRYFDQVAAAMHTKVDADLAATEAEDADEEPVLATPIELRALEAALVDAEIIGDRRPMRLAGPADSREPMLELQARLDRLQVTHPDAFAARLGELIFLANVLMAGSWYQGARFAEAQAAQAALACASLGLDCLLCERGAANPVARSEFIEAILAEPPGIVALFQLGWNLIQALPSKSAVALLEALRADHVREQLKRKLWILEEIEAAVTNPDLLDLIERGEFDDVGDNLLLLNLVLDARACQCLRSLIADFPRYPLQLNVGFQRAEATTKESWYLTSMRQLDEVDAFLGAIDGLLKI